VAEWEVAAAAVLRKAGKLGADDPADLVWDRLTRRTVDGIAIPPLGVPGDADAPNGARRNLSRSAWDIRVAALGGASALSELEAGANSLWLEVGADVASADFDELLAGVLLDLAPVVLAAPGNALGAAAAFCEWLLANQVRPADDTNLGADPLTSPVAEIAQLAVEAGVLGFVIDATAVHDRGASDAQELAYSLAAGAAYLRAAVTAGHSVDAALGLVEFRYAATDDQFVTIAKFRAARQLWARVAEICGASIDARSQRQHAVTSRAMMVRYDPWVNMLRTTVAAFAAGTGGADAVTVLPFDSALGEPDAFGRRIARNTSLLLVEESHVAKVADPAAGSYAVERLTDGLARAAWAEFGLIEQAGGTLTPSGDSSAWARIQQAADLRATQIATRKRPITGVSEFPLQGEELLSREPHRPGQWEVASYAAGFEALRDQAADHVHLVTMGPLAEHSARAGFATNLFTAGGVNVDSSGPMLTTSDVTSSYAGQPKVCLVGSDQAYAQWGAEAIAALRHAGARHVMLMGKPGRLAVDDSFALGQDALAFLTRTREVSA
jgi:methylmalonyl-CoA mutase